MALALVQIYAFEELIAELASAILSGLTKVDAEPRTDHAKYLNGWIKCLKDNPDAIQKAASAADKAATFILEAAEQSSRNKSSVLDYTNQRKAKTMTVKLNSFSNGNLSLDHAKLLTLSQVSLMIF